MINKNKLHTTSYFMPRKEIFSGVFLTIIIILVWSWLFNIYSVEAWKVPIGYQGDAWIAFAFAKAYMNGEIQPFLYQFVPSLNAPFSANWNDYAVTEDFIYASMGWLGRVIGLYAAANFMVLLAHMLSGLSFWYVCRKLRYKHELAFAGGLVYAFCHYIMARSLGHLVLSFFWHIPFLILVTSWCFSKSNIRIYSEKLYIAVITSIVCGLQNPYYTGMFIQFILFATLLHIVRENYQKAYQNACLISLCFCTFILMNANTIVYSIMNGSNPLTGARNLASLELYGLKIPELFLTPGNHFLSQFVQFSNVRYYGITYIKGEYWSPYLGISAIIGFILLISISIYRFLQGKVKLVPLNFWLSIWILLYSVVGGLNLLLGTFGVQYFRATNRYSIFILTISLLYFLRILNKKCPRYLLIPISLTIVIVAFAEEFTARFKSNMPKVNPISYQIEEDKKFAMSIEQKMPNNMVFQLPVVGFPEVGPIFNMGDYEHFRPYFYTQTLHYSYGTNKGRGDADWQKNIAQLPPKEMIKELEKYGFGVLMLNKKGYEDQGAKIIRDILKINKCIVADSKDIIAFGLNPLVDSFPIQILPFYGSSWYEDEGSFRWSKKSKSEIVLTNNSMSPEYYSIYFKLSSINSRTITFKLSGENLGELNLLQVGKEYEWNSNKIILPPGKSTIEFISNSPPVSAPNGDPRNFSFKISHFAIDKLNSDNSSNKYIENRQLKNNNNNHCIADINNEIKSINNIPVQLLYSDGWSVDEGTHRWSTSKESKITLNNVNNSKKLYLLEFDLEALSPRKVFITQGSKTIDTINIDKTAKQYHFKINSIEIPPGKSTISLSTNVSPLNPGNGDERMLSLRISNINFNEIK